MTATVTIVSKSEFAAMKKRGPSAISNWIAAGRITAAALVGSGARARIWVEQAELDLSRRLDPGQQEAQAHPAIPANGTVAPRPSDETDDMVDEIRQARLEQLRHQNRKLEEDAAARAGRYVLASDARREMGRSFGTLMELWEFWTQELCQALAGRFKIPLRDLQYETSRRSRDLRALAAARLKSQALQMPSLIPDGEDRDDGDVLVGQDGVSEER